MIKFITSENGEYSFDLSPLIQIGMDESKAKDFFPLLKPYIFLNLDNSIVSVLSEKDIQVLDGIKKENIERAKEAMVSMVEKNTKMKFDEFIQDQINKIIKHFALLIIKSKRKASYLENKGISKDLAKALEERDYQKYSEMLSNNINIFWS